jgi:hypothetical protein
MKRISIVSNFIVEETGEARVAFNREGMRPYYYTPTPTSLLRLARVVDRLVAQRKVTVYPWLLGMGWMCVDKGTDRPLVWAEPPGPPPVVEEEATE